MVNPIPHQNHGEVEPLAISEHYCSEVARLACTAVRTLGDAAERSGHAHLKRQAADATRALGRVPCSRACPQVAERDPLPAGSKYT